MGKAIEIKVESESLDIAIKKANRLVELLQEAQQIIGSLSGKDESESKKERGTTTSTGKRNMSPVEKLTEILDANFEDDAFKVNFSYSGTKTDTKLMQ